MSFRLFRTPSRAAFPRPLAAGATLLLLTISALFPLQASANPTYRVTDLGDLGNGGARAYAINDNGQVVGESGISAGVTHAFLYTNGVMTDLGTLGGTLSSATAINSSGQITGYAQTTGDFTVDGFLYTGGVMTRLGVPVATIASGEVFIRGINDHGQIAGYTQTAGANSQRSFLYGAGKITPLNKSGFIAFDIDDRGRVLGSFGNKARLYDHGKYLELGALGRTDTFPWAINDRGEIAGTWLSADSTPFLYADGKMLPISKRHQGDAKALNQAGVTVGTYQPFASDQYGFIALNGYMLALDSIVIQEPPSPTPVDWNGWHIVAATGINNRGQIVGYGTNTLHGPFRAVLLTPATPAVVPEGPSARIAHSATAVIRGWTYGPVTKVTYRIGKSVTKRTQGSLSRWHFTARLKPGQNKIHVIASDATGATYNLLLTARRL